MVVLLGLVLSSSAVRARIATSQLQQQHSKKGAAGAVTLQRKTYACKPIADNYIRTYHTGMPQPGCATLQPDLNRVID